MQSSWCRPTLPPKSPVIIAVLSSLTNIGLDPLCLHLVNDQVESCICSNSTIVMEGYRRFEQHFQASIGTMSKQGEGMKTPIENPIGGVVLYKKVCCQMTCIWRCIQLSTPARSLQSHIPTKEECPHPRRNKTRLSTLAWAALLEKKRALGSMPAVVIQSVSASKTLS